MTAMLVVKLGGSAGIDPALTLDDLAALWPEHRIVFIHGANAVLDEWMRRLGREPRLVTSSTGQVSRFTDRETMDLMLMVYAGLVNKRLVEGLQQRGINAVGLTAMDGRIASGPRKDVLRAIENGKPKVLRGDYAGSIEQVDTRLLDLLLDNGYLPVLTPPAVSDQGEAINVDGDKLAMQLAVALRAEALVILSNTPGLLRDVRDPASLIATIDVSDPASVEAAMTAAQGRMKKKVEAGCKAVQSGIGRVVFADARLPQPIQRALAGVGTVLTAGSRVEVRP
ncbi:MAG: [LysW]-aminoadipate kinase [Thermomicrobium sp.]|uniref:Putative [LysW]-aminoadipate kinase n=2 Tax=Thermomicrobiaceae TaxID=189777 RepID=B9KZP6_THERP|nr:acetylglutamate kinase [Thermomicrobium roseum DSM 5159]MBO9358824.1 [LysW]-aminoadipate kinase [Thermomicrobium sp.]MBO9386905.1 [LysW]-aminoadipate kinase [Thermomicrobium sp.]